MAYLRLNCPEGLDLSPGRDQFARSGLEPDSAPAAVNKP